MSVAFMKYTIQVRDKWQKLSGKNQLAWVLTVFGVSLHLDSLRIWGLIGICSVNCIQPLVFFFNICLTRSSLEGNWAITLDLS